MTNRKKMVAPGLNRSRDLARAMEHLLEFVTDYDEGRLLKDAFLTLFGSDEELREQFFELGYEPYFVEWMLADYRTEEGASPIDIFIEPFSMFFEDEEIGLMEIMRDSVVSLYRVDNRGGEIVAEDLLRKEEITVRAFDGSEAFTDGSFWVARFVEVGGGMELLGNPINVRSGDIDLLIERNSEAFQELIDVLPDAEWNDYLKMLSRTLYEYLFVLVQADIPESFGAPPVDGVRVASAGPAADETVLRRVLVDGLLQWCDVPHPKLDNMTPREAAGDERGRPLLSELLAKMTEIDEGCFAEQIGLIRAELKIED